MKICVCFHPSKATLVYSILASSEVFYIYTILNFLFYIAAAVDVKPQKENYTPDYNIYHNVSSLRRKITQIVKRNPNFMKLEPEYESRDKISQLVLRITNFTGTTHNEITKYTENSRLKILFAYGVHAREFLPTESLLYLLKNLTHGLTFPFKSKQYEFSRFILSHIDLYIISIANPDGRLHIEKTQNYCWRGTREGVDLDRNFDWEYGKRGSSGNPKDEEFRGLHKFSEPECSVFTDLTDRIKFDAFISFHSGIKHIYIPYADTKSKQTHRRPDNVEDMLDLAMELAHATKYLYKYGEAYRINDYSADGTIFDYMAGVRQIPFSYTIELWGQPHNGPSCFDLFNPPNEKLQEVLETIHPLYVKLFTYMINWKSDQVRFLTEGYVEGPSLTFGYSLVVLTAIVSLVVCLTGKFRLHPRRRIVSLKSLGSSFTTSFMKA